jgi:pimeloyl-ACP methyl ester carboxylesterase
VPDSAHEQHDGDAVLTYVLVHGGGATGRFWDRLLPYLDRPSVAVDLPGRNGKAADLATLTVDEEVAAVLADIEAARVPGPLVLVAHSSGGLVVPGVVAALSDRVEHVVLSAALVPPEGGCGLDCMQPRHADGLRLAAEQAARNGTVITLPGPPDDPESMRAAYGGDPLDDDALAFVVDPVRFVPDTVHHYFQPVRWSAAAEVPVTYIINARDRPIPPALQEEMAGRMPQTASRVHLESGHLPAVTMPAAFADRLRSSGTG